MTEIFGCEVCFTCVLPGFRSRQLFKLANMLAIQKPVSVCVAEECNDCLNLIGQKVQTFNHYLSFSISQTFPVLDFTCSTHC